MVFNHSCDFYVCFFALQLLIIKMRNVATYYVQGWWSKITCWRHWRRFVFFHLFSIEAYVYSAVMMALR